MKSGDVLFYSGETSLISRLIRFFTRSKYTHVALAIGDDTIIEANRFINTRIRKIDPSEVYEVYRIEGLTDRQRQHIHKLAVFFEGYRYDYTQIFGLLFRMIFKTKGNFFNRSNRFICSELIDVIYYASRVPRTSKLPIGDVTPQELLHIYNLRKMDIDTSISIEDQVVK